MFNQHELPGYVTTTVPIDDLEFIEFSDFFGACAAITQFRASDQDKEDANLVHLCFQPNVHAPIVGAICGCLGIPLPKARNLISGHGGSGMTRLTWVLMNMVDNACLAHVRDWAAFQVPSPINITAVRMAGYLWLGLLRAPRQSWKPLTHCTFVDPPTCDPEIQDRRQG